MLRLIQFLALEEDENPDQKEVFFLLPENFLSDWKKGREEVYRLTYPSVFLVS